MKFVNVVITGVGGQGLLTMARLLAEAAMARGFETLAAETHGMAQRGGSVVVFLRIGEEIYAPTFSSGMAHLVVSTELIEAVRSVPYLRSNGVLATNTKVIYPAIPGIYGSVDENQVLEWLRARIPNLYTVPASNVAESLGNPRATNMVMLGVASVILERWIDTEYLAKEVSKIGKGRIAEINRQAYERGREIAESLRVVKL